MTLPYQARLIEVIMDVLFSAERRRIDKLILALCDRNTIFKQKACFGFMYKGERFVPQCYRNNPREIRVLPGLAHELQKDVMDFDRDYSKLHTDMVHVKQLLTLLLSQCSNKQEVRDSLPECVVNLTDLRNMPRCIQDPAFLIRNNVHFLREYERTLPKIEFYSVTHMLY